MRVDRNKYGNERRVAINANLATILVKVLEEAQNSTEVAVKYGIEHEDTREVYSLKQNIEKTSKDELIYIGWSYEDVLENSIINKDEIEEHGEEEDYTPIEPIYELTEEEAREALILAEKNHDCNYGITWDTFKCL